MLYLDEKNWIFIRMDDGEDFYKTLYEVIRKFNVDSGLIFGGTGMLQDFEIGWFSDKTKEYENLKVTIPYELLSLNGNISIKDGDPFAHIHASLGGPGKGVIGGHLFGAKVYNTVEMAIMKFEKIWLEREKKEGFRPLIGGKKK